MATSDATCSNGLVGLENGEITVCCDAECGQCGGEGCGDVSGLSIDDCCAETIEENGQLCSETGSAPCVLDAPLTSSDTTCSNGVAGIESLDNTVCCDSRCEVCGGAGCGDTSGLSGEDCCTADIELKNEICSDKKTAPCVMDDDPVTIEPVSIEPVTISPVTTSPVTISPATTTSPVTTSPATTTSPVTISPVTTSPVTTPPMTTTTCSNGVEGVEDGDSTVCCNSGCEMCGGSECGANPGLTTADCCVGQIVADGQLCSVTETAPCVFDVDVEELELSTCSNGLAGFEDSGGKVCCAQACGQCGGVGCGSIEGTNGDTDCCSSTILSSGVVCGDGVEAPCFLGNDTSTIAPTASPTTGTFAPGTTLAPGATFAPTAGSRGGVFSTSPTVIGGTIAPSAGSRGVLSTAAPTATPTTMGPAGVNGASAASAGSVVTLAAMVGGMFAMFAAARK